MGDRSYYQIQVKQGNGLEIRDELKALFPNPKSEYDCWSYPGYELGPPYAYGKPAGASELDLVRRYPPYDLSLRLLRASVSPCFNQRLR